jgi:hypothetical protein
MEKFYDYAANVIEEESMFKDSVTKIFHIAFCQHFAKFEISNKNPHCGLFQVTAFWRTSLICGI